MNIRFTHIFGGVVAATLFAALPFAAFADAPSMPGHGHGRGHAYGLIGKEVVSNEDTTSTVTPPSSNANSIIIRHGMLWRKIF